MVPTRAALSEQNQARHPEYLLQSITHSLGSAAIATHAMLATAFTGG